MRSPIGSVICLCIFVLGLMTAGVGLLDDNTSTDGPNLVIGGLAIAGLGLIFFLAIGLTRRAPTWKPGTKSWHATGSIEILRSRMDVWKFLREPENAELILPTVERSFWVPARTGDTIQLQATLVRLPNDDIYCGVEQLVHELPGVRSEMRGVTGPPSHTIIELGDTPNGTLVTVDLSRSTVVGAVHLTNPKKALQTQVDEYLDSAKRILEGAFPQPASPSSQIRSAEGI